MYLLYKLFRLFCVSFYYYFMPFLVIIGSYLIPYLASLH